MNPAESTTTTTTTPPPAEEAAPSALEARIGATQARYMAAVDEFGDTADEVAPHALDYGDALLCSAEESTNAFSGDDDDDTLEIAFESLDVARLIYSRILKFAFARVPSNGCSNANTQRMRSNPTLDDAARKDARKQLSFAHLRLGNLAMEGDRFEDSLAEFNACLEIRYGARVRVRATC